MKTPSIYTSLHRSDCAQYGAFDTGEHDDVPLLDAIVPHLMLKLGTYWGFATLALVWTSVRDDRELLVGKTTLRDALTAG